MRLTREEKTASAKAQKNMTMDGFEGWKVSKYSWSSEARTAGWLGVGDAEVI